MAKLQRPLKDGMVSKDLIKYLPGMLPLAYQSIICAVKTKKTPADLTYKDLHTFEFKHYKYILILSRDLKYQLVRMKQLTPLQLMQLIELIKV